MTVSFRPFRPDDVLALDVQPDQLIGLAGPVRTIEHGRDLAAAGPAWTALDAAGTPLVCGGFGEIAPGRTATLWALLATRVGPAHLAITRFAREAIGKASYRRVDTLVRADLPRCARWARLVGLEKNTLLRAWGPDSIDVLLFERVV